MSRRIAAIFFRGFTAGFFLATLWHISAAQTPAIDMPGNASPGSNTDALFQQKQTPTSGKDKENSALLTGKQAMVTLNEKMDQLGLSEKYGQRLRDSLEQRIQQGTPIKQDEMNSYLQKVSDLANDFKTADVSRGHPTLEQLESMKASTADLFKNLDQLDGFKGSVLHTLERLGKDDVSPTGVLRNILERFASKYSSEHPEDPAIHQVLGSLHEGQGRPQEALQDYNQALRLDPDDQDALQGRSEVRFKLGNYLGADQDAREVLQLDPTNAAAIAMLKLTEGRTGPSNNHAVANPIPARDDASIFDYHGAQTSSLLDSGAPSISAQNQSLQYAKQAASALALKDFAGATREATLAIMSNPNNAQAYDYRAIASMKSGRYEAALEDVNHALRLLPGDPVSTITKAYIFNRLKRYQEAIALLNDAGFNLGSKNADALYNLAYAEAGLGNSRSMLNALSQAAHLDSGRFGRVYEVAMEAPQGTDLAYLFGDEGAANAAVAMAQAAAKSDSQRRILFTVLAALVGGLLMGLGFLHLLAPDWSRATTRHLAQTVFRGSDPVEVVVSGTYQIIRQIGSGGMGMVYEAFDLNLQRPVALKKMRTEIREDPRERQRFLKEARTVAALHHPNIVEIYSIVENAPELCLVFEYVEGQTLHQWLAEKGSFDFIQARKILREVCEALEYAHANDIIHRDLKPSNVMIARSGAVKVMDFGIARQVKDAVSRLMTNTIAGTPPYMAPEVERGMVGREVDVYSLGVCLYELLTGDVPFAGTGMGMLVNKMNMDFKPASSLVPGLPSGIDDLLTEALQPDPIKRIKTPADFLAAMESLTAV